MFTKTQKRTWSLLKVQLALYELGTIISPDNMSASFGFKCKSSGALVVLLGSSTGTELCSAVKLVVRSCTKQKFLCAECRLPFFSRH